MFTKKYPIQNKTNPGKSHESEANSKIAVMFFRWFKFDMHGN